MVMPRDLLVTHAFPREPVHQHDERQYNEETDYRVLDALPSRLAIARRRSHAAYYSRFGTLFKEPVTARRSLA